MIDITVTTPKKVLTTVCSEIEMTSRGVVLYFKDEKLGFNGLNFYEELNMAKVPNKWVDVKWKHTRILIYHMKEGYSMVAKASEGKENVEELVTSDSELLISE